MTELQRHRDRQAAAMQLHLSERIIDHILRNHRSDRKAICYALLYGMSLPRVLQTRWKQGRQQA